MITLQNNNPDYYYENDRVIFTPAFHIKRGSCCGNGCRHCPYSKPHQRGNTQLDPAYDNRHTPGENTGTETPVLPT